MRYIPNSSLAFHMSMEMSILCYFKLSSKLLTPSNTVVATEEVNEAVQRKLDWNKNAKLAPTKRIKTYTTFSDKTHTDTGKYVCSYERQHCS